MWGRLDKICTPIQTLNRDIVYLERARVAGTHHLSEWVIFQRCWGSIISSTGRRVSEATMKKEELEHGTGSDGFRQSPSLIRQLYIENRWQNSACSTSEPWYKYQTQPKSRSTEREAASRKTHQTRYVRYNSIWYPIQSLDCMSWSYFQ